MKNFTKTIILLFVLAIFTTCDQLWEDDDEFTMQRRPYDGDELRMDGYYYEDGGMDGGKRWMYVEILYNNGIRLKGYANKYEDVDRFEKEFQNGEFYNHVKDTKYAWGVFHINGDSIDIEILAPSSTGILLGYINSGKILNDTTFHLTESMRSNGRDVLSIDETYHFKKFDGKPDSTNKFIK